MRKIYPPPQLSPAAGWLKLPEKVAELQTLELREIAVGSIALDGRGGNLGDIYHWSITETINSLGIPGWGFEWFCENFKFFAEAAGASILRISIAPFGKGHLQQMVVRLCALAAQYRVKIIIEINLGCPNVWGEGGQKTIISYDAELTRQALQEVADGRTGNLVTIALKLSPLFDNALITQMVALSVAFRVSEIVTMNTVPNTTLFNLETEKTVIDAHPTGSTQRIQMGGLSGSGILPIAVGQVLMFRQAIATAQASIKLKGVGGITDADSLRQHVLAGADSMAIGQHFMQHGGRVFQEILEGYLTKYH